MSYKSGTVRIGTTTFHVKVALGLSKLRGMIFRTWSDVKGMLFPFPYEDRWGIEMPFCPPIDVVFIDRNLRVVDIQHAKPWKLDPRTWKIYRPPVKCKYVLELPPGKGVLFKRGSLVKLDI